MKNKKSVIMCFICLSIFILGFNIYTKACIRKDNKMDEIITSCKVDSDYPSSKNTKEEGNIKIIDDIFKIPEEIGFETLAGHWLDSEYLKNKDNIKMIEEKVKLSDDISVTFNTAFMDKNTTLLLCTIEDDDNKWNHQDNFIEINNLKGIGDVKYSGLVNGGCFSENQMGILYYGAPCEDSKQLDILIKTKQYGTKKFSLPIDKINIIQSNFEKDLNIKVNKDHKFIKLLKIQYSPLSNILFMKSDMNSGEFSKIFFNSDNNSGIYKKDVKVGKSILDIKMKVYPVLYKTCKDKNYFYFLLNKDDLEAYQFNKLLFKYNGCEIPINIEKNFCRKKQEESSKKTSDNFKIMDKKVKISDDISLLVDAVVIYKNSTLMFYTIEDSRGELGAWTYAGIISNIKIDNINYTNSEWTVPSDENHYEILYYGIPSKKEKQINISIETEEYGIKKLNLPIDKVNFVDKECKNFNKSDEEIQISNNTFEDKIDFNKKKFLENDGKITLQHFDDKKILHEINMQKGEKLIVQYDSEIKEGYFFIWITSPKKQIIDGLIKRNEKGVKEIIAKEKGLYKVGVWGINTSGKAEVVVKDLEYKDKTYEKSN